MTRIVFHTGFHKTGTTSLQNMLRHNRRVLKRHFRMFTRDRMIGACNTARAYSASPTPAALVAFSSEIAALFEQIDPHDPRPIAVSSEDLCGHMPGRRGLTSYDAAPALMKVIAQTAARAFATPPELTFYFSTRAPDSWLRSCYGQHLRAIRITDDFAHYRAQYAASANLERIVSEVRAAVAPHPVVSCALEVATTRPLGPLAPLLDALDMPGSVRRKIDVLPPANFSMPPELLDAFLAANRSALDDSAVAEAKSQARKIWLTGAP